MKPQTGFLEAKWVIWSIMFLQNCSVVVLNGVYKVVPELDVIWIFPLTDVPFEKLEFWKPSPAMLGEGYVSGCLG